MPGEKLIHACGWSRNRHALIPGIVALCLCLPGLSQGGLATDTAWYAAIGMQSWGHALDGEPSALWTLRGIAGQPYFNKPPLAFWLNGWPLPIFGASATAARLGSVIACVLCVLATARLGRVLAGRAVGLAAGLVRALTWEFIRHSPAFALDLWLGLFVTLAAADLATLRSRLSISAAVRAGAWLGLALMVKPLVPLLVLVPFAGWFAVHRPGALAVLPLSLFAALAVAAPWHLSMWWIHGDAFVGQYFGREVIDRAAAAAIADTNRGSDSPLYYLVVLARAYWPWLLTLILACVALARRDGSARVRSALFLSLGWCVVWLILLSAFPDKRPRYLLVLYPFASLASAAVLCRLAPLVVRYAWIALQRAALPVAAAVSLLLILLPVRFHRPTDPQWPALFAWLGEQPASPLYVGAFSPQRAAQVFLETGDWPIPTRSVTGEPVTDVPAGAMLIYHRRDGLRPGPGESVLFAERDVAVTRLERAPWSPVPSPDTGE